MAGERHPVFWDPDDDQLYRLTRHGGPAKVRIPPANLAAASVALPSRLGIANGWVLSVDDTAPTGMSWVSAGGGGGGGAPTNASYVVVGADATLTDERVLTAGVGIELVDGGAGSTMTVRLTGRAEQLESYPAPGFAVVDGSGDVQLVPLLAGAGITIDDGYAVFGSPTIRMTSIAGYSVLGVGGSATAAPDVLTASAVGDLLGRSAVGVAFRPVSLYLDTLGSTTGDLLVRGASSWSVVSAGTLGYVLTSNGPGTAPTWQAGGGGGGGSGLSAAQVGARVILGV